MDEQRLHTLAELGFNRLSFGVQDFDPAVQKAVHRTQPAEQVFALMEAARRIGFESVNVDLIYGLPQQTPESFDRTLAQVAELRPDRIALYAYAHLPERFKPQRRIIAAELPNAASKIAMLSRALDAFGDAGYVYIGMDHFALPNDALAVAKRQGGCTATSRVTARSPTVTSLRWACRPSGVSGRPTVRTPRRWRSITICSTTGNSRSCAALPSRGMT